MIPVAPLMIEHRLIERMIVLMEEEVRRIERGSAPAIGFIDTAIDFIRTYADKLHHGKEEDILFRVLAKKKMSAAHTKIMDELIREHVLGRGNVKKLIDAKEKFVAGDTSALSDMTANMGILVTFYPKHIEKEDQHFFLPVMSYLDTRAQDAMLKEFFAFDQRFIHAHYEEIVARLENKK